MDVVEQDDDRSIRGQDLEEPADAPEQLGQLEWLITPEPDRRGQPIEDLLVPDERPDLRPGHVGRVVLVDRGRRADELDDRPERDAVAVRQTPPAGDEGLGPDGPQELLGEPRLADPGVAEQGRHPARPAADRLLVRGAQLVELRLATDQRALRLAEVRRHRPESGQLICRHGLGLALEGQWRDGLDVDRMSRKPIGQVADDHATGGGGLLQSGRDVDRVARDQALAEARIAGHHIAGVDADRDVELHAPLGGERRGDRGELVLHVVGRSDRAKGVVLVADRATRTRP